MKDKRIKLINMPDDPNPVPAGSEGTCVGVDGLGQLLMVWDCGRSLSLIPGIDEYAILPEKGEHQ